MKRETMHFFRIINATGTREDAETERTELSVCFGGVIVTSAGQPGTVILTIGAESRHICTDVLRSAITLATEAPPHPAVEIGSRFITGKGGVK